MAEFSHSGTANIDDNRVYLRRLDELDAAMISRVKIVGVIAFTAGGKIVAVTVDRGIDLPSGHVEPHDPSPEHAARREVTEETGITLGPLVHLAYYRMATEAEPEADRYLAIYTAEVLDMGVFHPNDEARERIVLSPEEFADRYRPDQVALFRALVEEARQKLTGKES